jgi:hypothetical protein
MSSVVLSSLYTAISVAIFDELLTGQSTLYSFIGKNTDFASLDESRVKDNLSYDYFIKNNIAFAKRINISDISFVAPRYNWATGVVYDQYDDGYYGAYITSISVGSGGSGYLQDTTTAYLAGGNGSAATLDVSVVNGAIAGIGVVENGHGYTSAPTVVIVGAGTGATATANISDMHLSHSGKAKLSESTFYVVTSEYNVYKCLYNNLSAQSTVQPSHMTVAPVTTSDGYVWKFMYHIPLGLRRKFLTSSFMPVFSVLSSAYYSNGGISQVNVVNGGSGYSATTPLSIYVVGSGVGANFTAQINSTTKEIATVSVTDSGTGYTPSNEVSVKSGSRTGSTVTLTTTVAHNLIAGKSVVVSGTGAVDGTVTVLAVPTPTTFTYTSGTGTIALTSFGTAGVASSTPISLTSITRSSNVVTVVTTINHQLNEGNAIAIAGVTGFDGTYRIAKYISPTSFSFFQFGVAAVVSGTGTVAQAPSGISNIVRAANVVTVTTQRTHNFKAPIAISTVTRASNVTTVVTTAANTLLVGDTVIITGTVGFNGTYTISAKPNSSTFIFSNAGADAVESVGSANYAVAIADATGFTGTYAVSSILSSTSFTFAQSGADYSAFTPINVTYDTSMGISSNAGVSGKYGANTTAVVIPSILQKNGIGYTAPPLVHIAGTTGSGATGTAIVSGGKVTQINVTAVGSGYTSEPTVYFNGGSPKQAAATANIVGGAVTSYSVANAGGGYSSAPTVIVVGDGVGATATAVVGAGGITNVVVVNAGAGYSTATVYFAGGSDYTCSARAILYNTAVSELTIDNIIDSVCITDPGVGYTDSIATTISIVGDGTGASLTPYIRNGAVAGVIVDSAGEGYTYADLIIDGDGTGAKLLASVSSTNSLSQIDTPQYNVEVLAVSGAVSSVIVTNGGSGYTTPTVTITGNGSGATATAVVVGGVITKILVTNSGAGYTYANVVITGAGSNAAARVVLPPVGGHGFNAIYELFATKLITYTKISDSDLYNTFTFSNQFFQYGIIANPKKYNSTAMCTDTIISPCVAVDGVFTLSNFPLNAILSVTVGGGAKTLSIVDRTSTSLLLRAVDNYIPVVGDVLTNVGNSISYTATGVGNPTTSINTGSIIDVNNTTSFYKTSNQIISLRTLISL